MAEGIAPPPGFEIQGDIPPPPPGFQIVNGPGISETPNSASSPQGEKPGGILQMVKQAALPTLGSIGGAAAGGLITSPSVAGVPAGVLAGEIAGSALGEKANQWLGITEPSNAAVITSGLSAPLGRAIGPALNMAGKAITKTFAGRDVMSEAAERVLKQWLSPATASKQLFEQAENLKVFVPASATGQTVENLLIAEGPRARTPIQKEIVEALKPLRDKFIGRGKIPAIIAPEMMEESQRLRILVDNAYESGNTKLAGVLNQVRNAMLGDMENSGAGVVREAATAYRKEMAIEDLAKLIGKPHPLQKIHDFAKDNPLFKGAFSAPEMAQIERIAKKMAHVPASGGTGVVGKFATTSGGAAAGGIPGALVGFFGPEALQKLLGTQFGRNYTERILAGSSTLDHSTAAALMVFARGLMAQRPQEKPQ